MASPGRLDCRTATGATVAQEPEPLSPGGWSRVSDDSNKLTNTYDAFGNLTEAKHRTRRHRSQGHQDHGRLAGPPDPADRHGQRLKPQLDLSPDKTGATGIQETINYDATPLTSVAITRNARNMETSRVATIAAGNTVTRSVADSTSGRDLADRWISATLQETGDSLLTLNCSFDGAGRLSTQSGAGYTTGNSATYTYDSGPGTTNQNGTGLLDSVTLPLLLGGTVSGNYTYDANQRLASATVNGVAGSYTFDTLGNLKTDQEGSTTTNFTYNTGNQLTQSVVGSNTTVYGWIQPTRGARPRARRPTPPRSSTPTTPRGAWRPMPTAPRRRLLPTPATPPGSASRAP